MLLGFKRLWISQLCPCGVNSIESSIGWNLNLEPAFCLHFCVYLLLSILHPLCGSVLVLGDSNAVVEHSSCLVG